MSTENDQRTGTIELVIRLKHVDEMLRYARRNVHTLQWQHDEIENELRRRAARAERLALGRE